MGRASEITDRDRRHFERVAAGNRQMERVRLRETMALAPGERIARAIALSDAYLRGRPSPERDEVLSLAARWRARRGARGV
jgi:hypothetical protein